MGAPRAPRGDPDRLAHRLDPPQHGPLELPLVARPLDARGLRQRRPRRARRGVGRLRLHELRAHPLAPPRVLGSRARSGVSARARVLPVHVGAAALPDPQGPPLPRRAPRAQRGLRARPPRRGRPARARHRPPHRGVLARVRAERLRVLLRALGAEQHRDPRPHQLRLPSRPRRRQRRGREPRPHALLPGRELRHDGRLLLQEPPPAADRVRSAHGGARERSRRALLARPGEGPPRVLRRAGRKGLVGRLRRYFDVDDVWGNA